jgi:hypothetical protein
MAQPQVRSRTVQRLRGLRSPRQHISGAHPAPAISPHRWRVAASGDRVTLQVPFIGAPLLVATRADHIADSTSVTLPFIAWWPSRPPPGNRRSPGRRCPRSCSSSDIPTSRARPALPRLPSQRVNGQPSGSRTGRRPIAVSGHRSGAPPARRASVSVLPDTCENLRVIALSSGDSDLVERPYRLEL